MKGLFFRIYLKVFGPRGLSADDWKTHLGRIEARMDVIHAQRKKLLHQSNALAREAAHARNTFLRLHAEETRLLAEYQKEFRK